MGPCGAPRTPNARAQRALGVPQAPLSGAQRRRTPTHSPDLSPLGRRSHPDSSPMSCSVWCTF